MPITASPSIGTVPNLRMQLAAGLAPVRAFNRLPASGAALPSVTVTTNASGSAIPNNVDFNANNGGVLDSRYFRLRGTTASIVQSPTFRGGQNITRLTPMPMSCYEFIHEGSQFQLHTQGSQTSGASSYRLWVDGVPANSVRPAQLNANPSSTLWFTTFNFGSWDRRRIRIDLSREDFYGIRCERNASISRPDWPIGPRAVILGDSYTEGNAGDPGLNLNPYNGWPHVMCAELGLDCWASGVGGTGFLATSSNGGTYRSRVMSDVIALNPQWVFIAGGYNDRSTYTQAQLTAELTLLVQQIQASIPLAQIVLVCPWSTSSSPSTGDPSLTGARAAVQSVASAFGLPFLDIFPYFTGSNMSYSVGGATGGTYTLSFGGQTTGALAFNASAAAIQTALQGLSSVGVGNMLVYGSSPTILVQPYGTLLGTSSALTGSGASLTGGTGLSIGSAGVPSGIVPVTLQAYDQVHPLFEGHRYIGRILASQVQQMLFDPLSNTY